jgi:hypothetical protein
MIALAAAKVHMPPTDGELLDLVKTLVPPRTDPKKTLRAVEILSRYKGEVMEKAVVKDAVAEALRTYVYRIEWPKGWRKVDWK